MHRGSCLCGQVQYAADGPVRWSSHCWCTMCRKQHGAACGSYANVDASAFRYEKGAELVTHYVSSPGVRRSFCSRCGSTLTWTSEQYPDIASFTLGTLDTPFDGPVEKDLYPEHKPAWRPRN